MVLFSFLSTSLQKVQRQTSITYLVHHKKNELIMDFIIIILKKHKQMCRFEISMLPKAKSGHSS